jgi:hypothetical protein
MHPGRSALAALLLWCGAAEAQQLDFKRNSRSGEEHLTFRWRDHERREHTTAFTLTKQAIREAEASFVEFSIEAMWRHLERELRDEVAKFGNGATLEFQRKNDGLMWAISVRDNKQADVLSARLVQRYNAAEKSYLAQHLRRRVDERRILVDFAGATQAQQGAMRAVARALGDTPGIDNNDRARIGLALAFFQEIPYVLLEDKKRRGGDFLSAPALLAQNRGDCDSKAVALAAVLRTCTPWRRLAMITMPGHALLAVDVPAQPGERTIRAQGRQWVAVEAAGPAMAEIGAVGTQTAKISRRGARD